jgi:hypothetical protein
MLFYTLSFLLTILLILLVLNPAFVFNKTKFKVDPKDKGLLPVRFIAGFLLYNLVIMLYDMLS